MYGDQLPGQVDQVDDGVAGFRRVAAPEVRDTGAAITAKTDVRGAVLILNAVLISLYVCVCTRVCTRGQIQRIGAKPGTTGEAMSSTCGSLKDLKTK